MKKIKHNFYGVGTVIENAENTTKTILVYFDDHKKAQINPCWVETANCEILNKPKINRIKTGENMGYVMYHHEDEPEKSYSCSISEWKVLELEKELILHGANEEEITKYRQAVYLLAYNEALMERE